MVKTSQRGKIHRKFFNPFTGPYVCVRLLDRDNLRLMKVGSRKIISVHSNNCKLLPNRQQLLRFNDLSGRLNSPSTTTSDKNSSNNNTPDPFHYSTSLARNLNNLPPSGGAANNQNLPSPDHPLTPPDPPSDEEFYTGSDDSAPEMERSCLLYTSPSPRDKRQSRMPSSA